MFQKNPLFIVLIGIVTVVVLLGFAPAMAQQHSTAGFFEGRGIAQGAVFSRGQNANVTLTLDGSNFGLEMAAPSGMNSQNQPPTRIQYRGVISRRDNATNDPNSFTLNTRVRSFDSSENLRVITNTAGTCRMEVFGARVVYSNCKTATNNSSTQFLGLEQF